MSISIKPNPNKSEKSPSNPPLSPRHGGCCNVSSACGGVRLGVKHFAKGPVLSAVEGGCKGDYPRGNKNIKNKNIKDVPIFPKGRPHFSTGGQK